MKCGSAEEGLLLLLVRKAGGRTVYALLNKMAAWELVLTDPSGPERANAGRCRLAGIRPCLLSRNQLRYCQSRAKKSSLVGRDVSYHL